jgi:putative addiction module killer protein
MIEVLRTDVFAAWLDGLRDDTAVARIASRIDRLSAGNPGDVKSVGEGVSELRIDYGPGYRLYLTKQGKALVLLLCGGDKRTQKQDIRRAIKMVQELKELKKK